MERLKEAFLVLILTGCGLLIPSSVLFAQDVTLYVDREHDNASDDNGGTSADAPLLSLQRAADLAVANKRNRVSTRIVIAPGVYREFVEFGFTNYPSNDPDNATPIIFEARTPETVTLSGSDVWKDWKRDDANLFVHTWPHKWGLSPDPTNGARDVGDIVLRREMIFVNEVPLKQVLSKAEVTTGTFFIDEAAELVFALPPAGMNMVKAKVEVGIRGALWTQEWENNVTLRGIVFQHAVTEWADGKSAVKISASNDIVLDQLDVQWNNGAGLLVSQGKDVTLTNLVMNNNGWDGLRLWRNIRVLLTDSQTNYNNWRGHMGGLYGWSVGNKLHNTHGLTIRRHQANYNFSRGMWLDEDNEDVIFDEVEMNYNLSDGLFIEANQGPLLLEQMEICNNGGFGITAAFSEQVILNNNIVCRNADGAIGMTGSPDKGRVVINFETGRRMELFLQDWVMSHNFFEGLGRQGDLLFTTNLNLEFFERFTSNLLSDYNLWYDADQENVFRIPLEEGRRQVTLQRWREATGQDANSVFAASLPVELLGLAAVPAGPRSVELRWKTASESNNAGFEIQMFEAGTWREMGFVQGRGTTTEKQSYRHRLDELEPGRHYFRLQQIDYDGTFTHSDMVEFMVDLSGTYHISPPYPNPARDRATIRVAVDIDQHVDVSLFDVRGRLVEVLHAGHLQAKRTHRFELENDARPNGVYFIRVSGEVFSDTHALTVLK